MNKDASAVYNKKEAGNLLTEDSTFGTVAHIIAYQAFGDEMYAMDVDIVAPCALGATLNTSNINSNRYSIYRVQ